ncbi:transcriptional regulator with XRE-family HTH domain [Catenulispora sp. EB89]|uniref:helix-turn-helix domain-containing protein n=1 Tax=Catenulispora sp. EB89 TaxID=3156257 RepID=UPI003510E5AF
MSSTAVNPNYDKRKLRRELKRMREEAGLLQREVADAMDWSPTKVIRIESGAVNISTNDLKALMNLYGVTAASKVDEILAASRASRRPPWWSEYSDFVSPNFAQRLGYEASAAELFIAHPAVVPALLQTPDYARSVITSFFQDDVDRRTELRMRRQSIFERTEPPQANFVVGEAALHIQVGGRQVMRAQLERLLEVADRDHVNLGIIRFEMGSHPGMIGPFDVMAYDDGDGDVVSFETPLGLTLIREEAGIVSKYRRTFSDLKRIATYGNEATDLIKGLIRNTAR